MKFKFFSQKRNGEIAKTPTYFEELGHSFISLFDDNLYSLDSLYEKYIKFSNLAYVDISDQLFILNRPISNDLLKSVLLRHIEDYKKTIVLPKLTEVNNAMEKLAIEYSSKYGDIEYMSLSGLDSINKYKLLHQQKTILNIGMNSIHDRSHWNDNYHNSKLLVEDIKPLTPLHFNEK